MPLLSVDIVLADGNLGTASADSHPDPLDEAAGGIAVQEGATEEVALETWSRGPVLLIGDAAHATSPNMAEGAAMVLEGAVVLAESLVAAPDLAGGITLFQHRREPRTAWVREQTHRRDRARALRRVLRNQVLARFALRGPA